MSMDYMAFANGMLVESEATDAWKNRAGRLNAQLRDADLNHSATSFRYNGALDVIRLMMEEIRESNPESPLANKEKIGCLLIEMAKKEAFEQGYTFDDEGRQLFKLSLIER